MVILMYNAENVEFEFSRLRRHLSGYSPGYESTDFHATWNHYH